MTDIVERLRATDGTLDITTILDRCTEAADLIERLRRLPVVDASVEQTAQRIVDTGEALSVTNAEIQALARAYLTAVSAVEWAHKAAEEVKAAGPQKTRPAREFLAEVQCVKALEELRERLRQADSLTAEDEAHFELICSLWHRFEAEVEKEG